MLYRQVSDVKRGLTRKIATTVGDCFSDIIVFGLSRDYNCDSTTIRLYDPTTTYRARLLPFDAVRREQKMNMSSFRRSRVVVVS